MVICDTHRSCFAVLHTNDLYIVIVDLDRPGKASVTNDAQNVVKWLTENHEISTKEIVYKDTMGRFDKLEHVDGQFTRFTALTDHQQAFFRSIELSSDAPKH